MIAIRMTGFNSKPLHSKCCPSMMMSYSSDWNALRLDNVIKIMIKNSNNQLTIWKICTKSQLKFNENRVTDQRFPCLSIIRSCSVRKDFCISFRRSENGKKYRIEEIGIIHVTYVSSDSRSIYARWSFLQGFRMFGPYTIVMLKRRGEIWFLSHRSALVLRAIGLASVLYDSWVGCR